MTTPFSPVENFDCMIGDTFRFINNGSEWTISMIDGNACLLRYLTGHISADYPLNPNQWTPIK
jgi:hypothetical protein